MKTLLRFTLFVAAALALVACSNMLTELAPSTPNADSQATTADKTALELALSGTDTLALVTGSFALPVVGTSGSVITWTSDSAAVLSADGTVARPAIGAANASVTLTATITKGGVSLTKTFLVTVAAISSDATTAIAEDKASLVDAALKGSNADLANVKNSLALRTTGPSGTAITWTSTNAAISSTGSVTRPVAGSAAVTVTLTATITKSGGTTVTKTFAAVVQPISSDPTTNIAEDAAGLVGITLKGANADLDTVTGDLYLPTTGDSGTTISWASSDTAVVATSGTVTRPTSTASTVTLTATITKSGGTTVTKTFTVVVQPASSSGGGGGTTDSVINIAAINGVTAPVLGATPLTTITANAQYTGTVTWSGTPTTFAASTAYTATITLTAKTGYTLTGVAADSFTVSGATSHTNLVNSGVVTVVFPATGTTAVTFSSATQVGGSTNSADTTSLTLTFSVDPTTLAASDITLTGATKGALTGSGTTRSLAISAITVANGATVSVAVASPSGFTISGSPQTAVVYKAPMAVTFSSATQVGGTSTAADTTSLTLTFSVDPTTLAASDITLTGATKGALTGSGTTRSLAITDITVLDGATVSVSVASPTGYTITGSPRTAVVYQQSYALRDTGPAGGLIFYISADPATDGYKYLEVALPTWNGGTSDPLLVWSSPTGLISGATDYTTAAGQAGRANTTAIVTWLNTNGQTGRAAQVAASCTFGGKSDWFLPSAAAISAMYTNLVATYGMGGFLGSSTWYWSSTQNDAGTAYRAYPGNGGADATVGKTTALGVRPIRAFY